MKKTVLKYIMDKSKNSRKSYRVIDFDKPKPRLYETNFHAELLWGENCARMLFQHKICMGSTTYRSDLKKLEADQEALLVDLSIPMSPAETWKGIRRFTIHTDSYKSRLGLGTEPSIPRSGPFELAKPDTRGHAAGHLANSRYSMQLSLNTMKKKKVVIPFPGKTEGLPRSIWHDNVDQRGICMGPYWRSKLCHVTSVETGSSSDVVEGQHSTAEALQRQCDLHHAATKSFTDEVHRVFELQYDANWPLFRALEQQLQRQHRRREAKDFLKVASRAAMTEPSTVAAAPSIEPPITSTQTQTSSTRATTTNGPHNAESNVVPVISRSRPIAPPIIYRPIISRSRPVAPPRSAAGPSASCSDEAVTRGRQSKRSRDRMSPPRSQKDPLAGFTGPTAEAAQADYRRKKNLKFCDSPPPKYKIWEEESMRTVRREISP